ncbi:N-acetylmuramoyl-L-alanine amidase [Pleurocapsa sp. CCALA 161]|uniref:N-acetylmuramoyl-L-alanine amidase n=1 Tax=Pleurocapsa sp. CCALA 161 TaxID=2107688 RepID=UPI000D071E37|nr:N-acetylmuramoyl-L-alanine amidase [Pleurocapsa sp. CCALA 161]PSB10690.1 N-acetylmuramoyl-L-alanine amidase [Pleurocapsa sp. CCALA 161]
MRFHWLLSGFIGVFLLCSPAKAGKIVSWEFEPQDNNLVFETDEGVQPKAELLSNPTRLVIDLPGTVLGQETVKESYQGPVKGFRIGQPESDTSRIVVELAPGYTLDADQIEFDDISPTHWQVEIPEPEVSRVAATNQDPEILELPEVDLPTQLPGLETAAVNPVDPVEPVSADTSSDTPSSSPYVKATSNGFFIDIDGNRKIKIDSERDGDRLDFSLEGITLPVDLADQSVAVNQYGVATIDFEQQDDQAVMSMELTDESPDWIATFSRIKGLLLVPKGELPNSTAGVADAPLVTAESQAPEAKELNLIEEIELVDDTQLMINGDRELSAVVSRKSNGIYQVILDNTELAEDFQGPELRAGSPISELKVRQENTQVVLEITTRLRYRLGQLNTNDNEVALPIEVGVDPLPESDAPLLPPGFAKVPKESTIGETPLLTTDRPRVIIDAGHGGYDSGAIGINGLREKDVILPIALDVEEILRKQDIDVVMTRDKDIFISLEGRTDLANRVDADLFVSIHANAISLSRPDVSGLETYYYDSGRRLAELIHWSVLNGVDIDDRSIRRARFYVLRHSAMPAVLVEVGFVTGEVDASRLKDPDHRRQMAEAIARGIVEYIKQNNL